MRSWKLPAHSEAKLQHGFCLLEQVASIGLV
jgi:hypothetical protein